MKDLRLVVKKEIIEYCQKFNLDNLQNKVINHLCLALSGGKDSLALFIILLEILKKEDGLYFVCLGDLKAYFKSINLLYFNHETREESSFEEEYIASLARKWHFSFYSARTSDFCNQTYQLKQPLSEADLRIYRYLFFTKIADQLSQDGYKTIILLAHHQSDQVETIIQRLMRGCSLGGFLGIPKSRDIFLRPLISISGEEIKCFLADNIAKYSLQVCEDNSNATTIYQRNFVRHEVIPYLAQKLPTFLNNLWLLNEDLREYWQVLNEYIVQYEKKYVKLQLNPLHYVIERSIGELPPIIVKDIFKNLIGNYAEKIEQSNRKFNDSTFQSINREFLNNIYNSIKSNDFKILQWKNLKVVCDLDKIYICEANIDLVNLADQNFGYPILKNINTKISFIPENFIANYLQPAKAEGRIESKINKPEGQILLNNYPELKIYFVGNLLKILYNEKEYVYDFSGLDAQENLTIRVPVENDWYFGKTGKINSFNKFLKKQKIPNIYRKNLLVIAKDKQILFACGRSF